MYIRIGMYISGHRPHLVCLAPPLPPSPFTRPPDMGVSLTPRKHGIIRTTAMALPMSFIAPARDGILLTKPRCRSPLHPSHQPVCQD